MSEYKKIYLGFFRENDTVPVDLFLHVKGQFIPLFKKDSLADKQTLDKLEFSHHYYSYIKESDEDHWNTFLSNQMGDYSLESIKNLDVSKEAQITISKMLNFSINKIRYTKNDGLFQKIKETCEFNLKNFLTDPSIRWYIELPLPESSRNHGLRVAQLINIFLTLFKDLLPDDEFRPLILSSLIHSLNSVPENYKREFSSENTLKYINENKIVLPRKFIELIEMQNECIDQSGGPNKVKEELISLSTKIFSIFDYFDHYRLTNNNPSKKQKILGAIEEINKNKEKFDPVILRYFHKFIKVIEIVG